VQGVVTDRGGGQALADATVRALGAPTVSRTGTNGRYRLSGLSAGPIHLEAIRVGYERALVDTTLPTSGTLVINFQLHATALRLDEITVTAAGQSNRHRESGASVARIIPDSIPAPAIQSFSDLITGRTAGVTVLHSAGASGMGSRVRIRGSNSLLLTNEPLYLIDGIRADNTPITFSFETGDQSPSRLDDIDQEFLQAVDVLKGPAATAMYGTAAANGVLQLQTRQGSPGPARWTSFAEGGLVSQAARFPANYGLWTRSVPPDGGNGSSGLCTLVNVADGACVADSLAEYNPLVQADPFRTGSRMKVGLTVGGGVPAATYFLGTDVEHEAGISRVNDLDRVSLRANLTTHLRRDLDVSLLSGYLHRSLGVPQEGFTYLGPMFNGLEGWPFPQSVDAYGHPTFGYWPIGPDQFNAADYSQRTDHADIALTGTWRPRAWLTVTGVTGLDHVFDLNRGIVPPDQVFLADYLSGLDEEERVRSDNVTANWAATAQWPLSRAIRATLTGGTQYAFHESENRFSTNASGPTVVTELGAQQKTLGAFLSGQIAVKDRVFVSAGLRSDWSGGFGGGSGNVLYPSLMGSWVISDEGFFPRSAVLSSLRLRAAYGRSGLLPRPTDQLTLLRPVTVPVGGIEVPTVTDSQVGNPDLRPERIDEIEAGFDAELAHGRVTLQGTYYRKRSYDALVAVPLAASLGSGATQLQNVGEVRNEGIEVGVSADAVRSRTLVWNLTLTASANRNRLESLGGEIPFVDVTALQRLVPGYPLGGFWVTREDSVVDLNRDGLIGSNEVFLDPNKPRQYAGTPLPTRSMSLTSSLDLPHRVRLWAQLDYDGGQRKFDFTERLRCEAYCRGLNVVDAPLADKAKAAVASLFPDPRYAYDYIEDASFLKWRELGLEWTLPERWARSAHAGSMRLSVAVRNLATWTPYPGLDPEAYRVSPSGGASNNDNFRQVDYFTEPQVRHVVARLTVDF